MKKYPLWVYTVNEYTVRVTLTGMSFTFEITKDDKRVRAGGNYSWDEFQHAVFDVCIKPTETESEA